MKPFSPRELSARIRAGAAPEDGPGAVGALPRWATLTVNYARRSVVMAGQPVHLTPTEYRVPAELSANAGQLLTYERLLDRVWEKRERDSDVRPIRTIVHRLRRKLGDDADNPTYIFTEPRVGYRMPEGEKREQDEA